MTSHDKTFKEFLHRFLPQFVEGFLPHLAAQLKLETFKPIVQELIINMPVQLLLRTDFVAEVETISGEPSIILIHTEIESNLRNTFSERMFSYYSFLRLVEKKLVLPIVLSLKGGKIGIGLQTYNEGVLGENFVNFRYYEIGLDRLDAAEYGDTAPVIAALTVLMGFDEGDSAVVKLNAMKQVGESPLRLGDKDFLMHLVRTYLPTEDVQGDDDVVTELRKYEEGWLYDRICEAEADATERAVLRLMNDRFGTVPDELEQRIHDLKIDALDDLLLEIHKVETINQIEARIDTYTVNYDDLPEAE